MSTPSSPLHWDRRFGQHVEAARTRALMSRAQLADRLDVAEESIRRWERGGACPGPDRLARLIAILSLEMTELSPQSAPPDDLPPLARRLRYERSGRGITQAQAARILGVAQPTYAGWEIGRATPGAHLVATIASFLGAPEAEAHSLLSAPFVVDSGRWPPLGRIIGSRRQALRLTREKLAEALRVSTGTVVAWELGYRLPGSPRLGQLASALEVPVEQLEAAMPRSDMQLSALGELISARQRSLGLRRSDIAQRARLDEATLSRWAHGLHAPGLSRLRRLAAAIDVPFERVCLAAGVTST